MLDACIISSWKLTVFVHNSQRPPEKPSGGILIKLGILSRNYLLSFGGVILVPIKMMMSGLRVSIRSLSWCKNLLELLTFSDCFRNNSS